MYYDMSGFDYGILDVVQVLHLRKRRGNYYDCPFCGETHGKLNINVEKNVFRCNRCDASGGFPLWVQALPLPFLPVPALL